METLKSACGQLMMNPETKAKLRHVQKILVPLATFFVMAYGSWAYGHLFCYKVVHQHLNMHKSITIGLMVTEAILFCYSIFLWSSIVYLVGPGYQPTVLPYGQITTVDTNNILENPYYDPKNQHNRPIQSEAPLSTHPSSQLPNSVYCSKPPEMYVCDENGYPPWCTMCQSIKQPRTHHSTHLNKCIWKFDHYCLWIGQVIGGANYKLFLQFTLTLVLLSTLISVSIIAVYFPNINSTQHRVLHRNKLIEANVIVIFILSTVGGILCFMLLTEHFWFIARNQTSIEVIQRKNSSRSTYREYIAVFLPEQGERRVIEAPYNIFQRRYWTRTSIIKNFKQQVGLSPWQWVLPTTGKYQELDFKLGENYCSFVAANLANTTKIYVEGDHL